jgi:hypothetical protein
VGSTGCGNRLVLLNEPVFLGRQDVAVLCGALSANIGLLGLVGVELVRNVGLLGRLGSGGDGELLDVALGVVGLDLGDLVVLELAEVEVLHQIGCTNCVSRVRGRAIVMMYLSERPKG